MLDLDSRATAIRVEGVNHYFGAGELRKQVLYQNQLEVKQGEIVIMTGPSGSGKTTLLTLIGALRTVMEGQLTVAGHRLDGATAERLVAVRRDLGFIFQAHNLFDSLTAFENVRMALELFDLSDREMSERIEAILTRLGLGDHLRKKPGKLSGGQKQRVAIARGLVHRPAVVLADEPTAALDEASGREVVSLFQELAAEYRTTILMVTHDNRILDVADRIVNMVDGRIKSDVLVHEASTIASFLKDCFVFKSLSAGTLTEVAEQMVAERFAAGEMIIRQGEQGDKFYLIRRGVVAILFDDGQKTVTKATVGEGDFFGEVALITGEPRNASIQAKTDVVVYSLQKDDFQRVRAQSATFEEEVRRALFERQ